MRPSLPCPTCSRPIADLSHTASRITCAFCKSKYGVVYGKLSRRSSIYETLLHFSSKLPTFYRRHYTLQITTADRNLKLLQFSVPGKTDDLPVQHGDIVSALYTLQGYLMKTLVLITNHTTGKRYVPPNPIPGASYVKLMLGTVVLGLLLGSSVAGVNLFLASAVSALGGLLLLKVTDTAQLSTLALETCGREGTRLMTDQKLLVHKAKLEHRLDELNHDCKSIQFLIDQLEALKQKMLDVDRDLYSVRIYRSTSAIGILKQQITNNTRLMREYRRTLRMIEIEIDTSWIADQLPNADNFTRAIAEKLAELKEIEDQNQFLKLQLAAYEEVGYHRIGEYNSRSGIVE